jgi:hypothetical protein
MIALRSLLYKSLLLFSMALVSFVVFVQTSAAATGSQGVIDTRFISGTGPMMANSFTIVAEAEGPTHVDPGEVFDVELFAWCSGDDFSPKPDVRVILASGASAQEVNNDADCLSALKTSVGTVQVTAPVTPGPASFTVVAGVTGCFPNCLDTLLATPETFNYTVNSVAPPNHDLTVNSLGASSVNITGDYSVTTDDTVSGIADGTTVTLIAPATRVGVGGDPHYFLGWTGCDFTAGPTAPAFNGLPSRDLSCSITMNSDDAVTARYSPSYDLSSNLSTIPAGSSVTMEWTSDSAFSCTEIANPHGFSTGGNPNSTDATTNLASSYTFAMTCTGSGGTGPESRRTITVTAAPNSPPTADAGPNRVIIQPYNSVDADGTGSADSDGVIDTYSWTKIGGPVGGTIINGDTANPTFTDLDSVGVYTFRLTVTDDDGDSDTDAMTVTIVPPATPTPTAVFTSPNPASNPHNITIGDGVTLEYEMIVQFQSMSLGSRRGLSPVHPAVPPPHRQILWSYLR